MTKLAGLLTRAQLADYIFFLYKCFFSYTWFMFVQEHVCHLSKMSHLSHYTPKYIPTGHFMMPWMIENIWGIM